MNTIPKRVPPKHETPAPRARDHEHVGRISTQTTIFVLIAVALVLYEIQWILPPFVFAGLIAYITTPAIDRASAQSRLPRLILRFAGVRPVPAVRDGDRLSRHSAARARNDSCF